MTRQLLWPCAFVCALFLVRPNGAEAEELPTRKAGLWEMKVAKTGAQQPEMTLQHCTDETTDKDLNNTVSPMAKQMCSKQEVRKTATGYAIDAICKVAGMSMTSHSEMTGDLNSAYSVTTTSRTEGAPANVRDVTTRIDAKWLGPCKEGQRAGDIVMPGGFKLNIKDAEKLKGLLPKSNSN